jgi:hypothetical protein
MPDPADKIRLLDRIKRMASGEPLDRPEPRGPRDLGRVALILSIVCLGLLVVLFLGFSRSLSGLSGQVRELEPLKADLATLQTRVLELEKLPARARNMVIDAMLEEMGLKASSLAGLVGDARQAEQLAQVQAILKQVRDERAK